MLVFCYINSSIGNKYSKKIEIINNYLIKKRSRVLETFFIIKNKVKRIVKNNLHERVLINQKLSGKMKSDMGVKLWNNGGKMRGEK